MRRRTPGVLAPEELVSEGLRRLAALDASRVREVLEPLVIEPRKARLREVFAARLGSVRVLFDAPYDPHNGAAVLRSCEAFGVQHLHVIEKQPFLAAGSVARGSIKWVDVHTATEAETVLAPLRAASFELVAAHPDGELSPEDLASIPRCCIVVGNERDGIRPEAAAECRRRVRVPMRGFVESLNVSVTTAILLHAATAGRPGDLPDEEKERLYVRGLYFSVQRADEVLAGRGVVPSGR